MEYAQYKKKYANKDGQLIKVEANTNTFLEKGEYERSRLYYVLSRRKVKKEKAKKIRNTIDKKVERRRKKFSRKFDSNYPTLSEIIRIEKNKLNPILKKEIKTRKRKKTKISNNSSNSSNHSEEQKELIISQSQTQEIYSNIYNQEQSPYQSLPQSSESPDNIFQRNEDFLDLNNNLSSLHQFKNDTPFNADYMFYHNIMEDSNQTHYLSISNENYFSTENSSISSHCLELD